MDATELIEGVIEVLQTDGWCKHRFVQKDGSRCVMGALGKVASTVELTAAMEDTLRAAGARVEKTIGVDVFGIDGPKSISAWNDAPETSYEDVILGLKKAAYEEG